MTEKVECHSGYEYAERPTAVWWQGQRLEVEEVEERWRIPGGKCFRVRTVEGLVFNLTYVELFDEWRIHQL
ncbi:MAG: hypothetical protein HY023_04990 [Chloroflexi bacterium]|nr:hypothetical protein [Chloroflexota bacterium]MBI3762293.1 hypothetical protein [Chloroflexota bacterium]